MKENKLTVLLVDDEIEFLNSISERIQLKGFETLTASSGKEAIELAKKHTIHVSVVDLKMPDMDGLVTITKLKEIQPDIKTVPIKYTCKTDCYNRSYACSFNRPGSMFPA